MSSGALRKASVILLAALVVIQVFLVYRCTTHLLLTERWPLPFLPMYLEVRGKGKSINNTVTVQEEDDDDFPPPMYLAESSDVTIRLPPPRIGMHRPTCDAIFAMAIGSSAREVAQFVGSLIDTGFHGDVVLGVNPWNHRTMSQDLKDYLTSHDQANTTTDATSNDGLNLIAHEMVLHCNPQRQELCKSTKFYLNTTTGNYIKDIRGARQVAQLRFEYYWAWTQLYLPSKSRIFLSDLRDVFFQQNPFDLLPAPKFLEHSLHVFEEFPHPTLAGQRNNQLWISSARGWKVLDQIGNRTILCSGTTIGGQPAIDSYLKAMVLSYDETQCLLRGCDQGHHNYLIHSGRLLQNSTKINNIVYGKQGSALVNTIGLFASQHNPIRAFGLVDNTTDQVLNWDGSVSPVVHQYDRDQEMNKVMSRKGAKYLRQWKETYNG